MPTLLEAFQARQLFSRQKIKNTEALRERAILKCAKENDGVVTVFEVASSGLSIKKAKLELDRLYREGHFDKDIDELGNEIYQFKGQRQSRRS